MVFTATMTTVSIAVLLAIGFIGWIVWEIYNAPIPSDKDFDRISEMIRKACRDEIADFD